MNIFEQEEFNPPGNCIRFRHNGRYINYVVIGDIDIIRSRRCLEDFRRMLRRIRRCWACFQNYRTMINFPCCCVCNCTVCSWVMTVCSMCGNRITNTREILIL